MFAVIDGMEKCFSNSLPPQPKAISLASAYINV